MLIFLFFIFIYYHLFIIIVDGILSPLVFQPTGVCPLFIFSPNFVGFYLTMSSVIVSSRKSMINGYLYIELFRTNNITKLYHTIEIDITFGTMLDFS